MSFHRIIKTVLSVVKLLQYCVVYANMYKLHLEV